MYEYINDEPENIDSMSDYEFHDYLIKKLDDAIDNKKMITGRWTTSYPEPGQKNCRCTPMPQGNLNLWAAVFYITVDYDQFTREHKN